MNLAYYEANVGHEYSKSANAARAEAEGRYPMTIAAKKLGLSTRAFRAGCAAANYEATEWHHTGKYARRTDYYDTNTLAANPDFWRGAASTYSPRKAKEILAAHNVNPLSDAELAAAREAATRDALKNVTDFLAHYGDKFVIQAQDDHGPEWQSKGYKAQLEWDTALGYHSALPNLGLFSGYDADRNRRRIYDTREAAEAALAVRKQYLQKVQAEHPEWKNFDKPLRVVTVREDVLTDCALYGRVAGQFERLGQARDYLQ